jgi:dipeptidyl aminopeptidase/acylaminoacyl peptidase
MPWREIGVLAVVAILLAVVAALLVGSRSSTLPPPFGPAGNGVIAMGLNGDLYTVDPASGAITLLLGGPEVDEWVGFTRDGTRGVFTRWVSDVGGWARVGTVPVTAGAAPTFIKQDVIRGDFDVDIAPSGRELAFSVISFGAGSYVEDHNVPPIADETANTISVAAIDQSAFQTFGTPVADYGGIEYLAPDGREIVFLARSPNGHTHDIRAVDAKTGQSRPIVETSMGNDIVGNLSAAPDGKHIAYALQGPTGAVSVHVVGTNGKDDRVVGHAPGAIFEAWPQWDPQGRRLLIERRDDAGVVHPVIVDLNGGPDVVVQTTISANGAGKQWSPDGASILAQRTAADGKQLQQELWNAQTGVVTPVSWPSVTAPSWQRIAAP